MVQKIEFSMQNIFQLQRIEKACFGRDAWSIPNLTGEFQHDFSHFFGIYNGDEIVAYTCVRVMYEEAQVCNIAVLPDYRRRGYATALVDTLCAFSAEHGCLNAELEVNTENEPAYKMYQKCGFTVAGIRKNFYGKSRFKSRDAYTMVKPLVAPVQPD